MKEAFINRDPRNDPSWPEKRYNFAVQRASEIAGVIQRLLDNGYLAGKNLKGSAIDLGTGTGAGILAWRAHGVKRAIGIDYEEDCQGRETYPRPSLPAIEILGNDYKKTDTLSYLLREQEGSVNLISAFFTVPWLWTEEVERQARRVLASGGQAVVTWGRINGGDGGGFTVSDGWPFWNERTAAKRLDIRGDSVPGFNWEELKKTGILVPTKTMIEVDEEFVLVGTKN